MFTDKIPRAKSGKEEYWRSDKLVTMPLPPARTLRLEAERLEQALLADDRKLVESVCNSFSALVADSFAVPAPPVKVLGVRPLKVYEKFGDYDFETTLIRLWMRTARLKKVTAYGTFLSTLCHELCHHLDVVHLELPHTYHTRGFYERAALLYHHARNTPVRKIVWTELDDGTFEVNWAETMKHGAKK